MYALLLALASLLTSGSGNVEGFTREVQADWIEPKLFRDGSLYWRVKVSAGEDGYFMPFSGKIMKLTDSRIMTNGILHVAGGQVGKNGVATLTQLDKFDATGPRTYRLRHAAYPYIPDFYAPKLHSD